MLLLFWKTKEKARPYGSHRKEEQQSLAIAHAKTVNRPCMYLISAGINLIQGTSDKQSASYSDARPGLITYASVTERSRPSRSIASAQKLMIGKKVRGSGRTRSRAHARTETIDLCDDSEVFGHLFSAGVIDEAAYRSLTIGGL